MLLAISSSKVQELLRITPQIRHGPIESLRILYHWDQAHISSCLFNGERLWEMWNFIVLSRRVENIRRWILWSDVSAKENTLSIHIFTIGFDVSLFKFTFFDTFDPVCCSK